MYVTHFDSGNKEAYTMPAYCMSFRANGSDLVHRMSIGKIDEMCASLSDTPKPYSDAYMLYVYELTVLPLTLN